MSWRPLEKSDLTEKLIGQFEIQQAKFADVKVGDTIDILHKFSKKHSQRRVLSVSKIHIKTEGMEFEDELGYRITDGIFEPNTNEDTMAIGIVPPQDVIVDFGAFKGTVEQSLHHNALGFSVFNEKHTDNCFIAYSMLTPAKRAEVEELLKAIANEKEQA